MEARGTKVTIGLLLSLFSTAVSIGSIAYAAGTLGQRIHDVETRQVKLDTVPERLAVIETKLDILISDKKK